MDVQTFERHPVDVRGPLTGGFRHRQRVTTFARVFVHDGRLVIAETADLGKTISQVTAYTVPTEEPIVKGNTTKWGEWVFSGCSTCRAGRSKWRTHTRDEILGMLTTPAE